MAMTVPRYSQLSVITETLIQNTTAPSALGALLDQIALHLQTVNHPQTLSNGPPTVSIIHEILTSLSDQSSSVTAYSWMITGVLSGSNSGSASAPSSSFCRWVERGLIVGQSLLSIVEMEEEVKRLGEEKSALQTKEDGLRVEKKALSRRLEDSEKMLEKYVTEMRLLREEKQENKSRVEDEEKIATLTKDNQVSSSPSSSLSISFIPLSLCLSLCLSLSLSIYLFLSFSLSISVSLPLSISLSLSHRSCRRLCK
jgi:hypothetical protein